MLMLILTAVLAALVIIALVAREVDATLRKVAENDKSKHNPEDDEKNSD